MLKRYSLNFGYALVVGIFTLVAWSIINFISVEMGGTQFFILIGISIIFAVLIIFCLLYGDRAEDAYLAALLALVFSALVLKVLVAFVFDADELAPIYDLSFSIGIKSFVLAILALGIVYDFADDHSDSDFPNLPSLRYPDMVSRRDLEASIFHNLRRDVIYGIALVRMANRINNLFISVVANLTWAVMNILIGTAIIIIGFFNNGVRILVRIIYHLIWTLRYSIAFLVSGGIGFIYSAANFARVVLTPLVMFIIAYYFLLLADENIFTYIYDGDLRQIFVAALQLFLVGLSLVVVVWALTRVQFIQVGESLVGILVDKYSNAVLLVFMLVSTFLGIRGTFGISNILGVGIPKIGPFQIGPLTIGSYALVFGVIIYAQLFQQRADSAARAGFDSPFASILLVFALSTCCMGSFFLIRPNLSQVVAPPPALLRTVPATRVISSPSATRSFPTPTPNTTAVLVTSVPSSDIPAVANTNVPSNTPRVNTVRPKATLTRKPSSTPQPTETATPEPPKNTATPESPPGVTINYFVEQDTLTRGSCTILHWGIDNVQAIYLNGEGIRGFDERRICPESTTIYTLRIVLRDGNTIERSIVVRVQ